MRQLKNSADDQAKKVAGLEKQIIADRRTGSKPARETIKSRKSEVSAQRGILINSYETIEEILLGNARP